MVNNNFRNGLKAVGLAAMVAGAGALDGCVSEYDMMIARQQFQQNREKERQDQALNERFARPAGDWLKVEHFATSLYIKNPNHEQIKQMYRNSISEIRVPGSVNFVTMIYNAPGQRMTFQLRSPSGKMLFENHLVLGYQISIYQKSFDFVESSEKGIYMVESHLNGKSIGKNTINLIPISSASQ